MLVTFSPTPPAERTPEDQPDAGDDDGGGGTAATVRESRAGTIYTKTSFTDDLSLELGRLRPVPCLRLGKRRGGG